MEINFGGPEKTNTFILVNDILHIRHDLGCQLITKCVKRKSRKRIVSFKRVFIVNVLNIFFRFNTERF